MKSGNNKLIDTPKKKMTDNQPDKSTAGSRDNKTSTHIPPGTNVSSNSFDCRNTSFHSERYYQLQSDHPVTYLGVIDATTLSVSDALVMQYVLHIDNVGRLFTAGSHYFELSAHAQPYYFTTTYALSISTDDYNNITCDVIDTKFEHQLGDGTFGTVNPVVGSIKLRYATTAGLIFSPGNDKSVVKIGRDQHLAGSDYIQSVVTEYDRAYQASHLRVRPPTFYQPADNPEKSNQPLLSCLPMRRMEGESLFYYIQDPDKYRLTTDDCYQLSIELFRQLAKQVHKKGFVHCDIKPENIMIYKNDHGWQVNIIDVNLAQECEGYNALDIGTAAYIARENHIASLLGNKDEGLYTKRSDVFAMGLINALLWGDKNQRRILLLHDKDKILKQRDASGWEISFDMRDVIEQLPKACQESLIDLLTQCTDKREEARPSATVCAFKLEEQYLLYKKKTSQIPADHQSDADAGFAASVAARKLFMKFFDAETNTPYTINSSSVEELRTGLIHIISTLPDNIYAVREFVFATHVEVFKKATNKEEITQITNHIIDNFWLEYKNTQALFDSLSSLQASLSEDGNHDNGKINAHENQLHSYREGVVTFLSKILCTTVDLDEIAAATSHLQRKQSKILAAKQYFSTTKQSETPTAKDTSDNHPNK